MIKIDVDNFADLIQISQSLSGFDFRGQKDVRNELKSTIERYVTDLTSLTYIEKATIIDFQVKSQNYLIDRPRKTDFFNWLAIIQHYGGYTRLLDFTRSLYIALFFAFEDTWKSERPVIWAVNGDKFNKKLCDFLLKNGYDKYLSGDINPRILEDILYDVIENKLQLDFPFVCKFQPYEQFSRVGVQQGVFYTILNSSDTFDNQLCSSLEIKNVDNLYNNKDVHKYSSELNTMLKEEILVRITFGDKINKAEWLKELWKMNISSESLFPGLEGFAKSIRHTVRINI